MDQIQPGQRQISADTLNRAIDGAELSHKTTVAGANQSRIGASDRTIAVSRPTELRYDPNTDVLRTVVVKKSPSVNAGWVRVQRVQYKDNPPQPCTDSGCRIQVWGDEFDVRPQYGKQDDSYERFEVSATIDQGTKFFEARWEDEKWILNWPEAGGEVEYGYITAIIGNFFIIVQGIKQKPPVNEGDPWDGTYVNDGPPRAVVAWPGTNGSGNQNPFWTPFISAAIDSTTLYVLLVMIDGVEYAFPTWAINTFTPNPAGLAGDC